VTRILIVAGDPSGDLIASQLVDSLKRLAPHVHVTGIGGAHLKKVSDYFLENIVEQHALGFAVSPNQISYFRNVLNKIILPELLGNKVDIVIPVDFYGFNSRVAKAAHKNGKKVFYYASPQFWASRPWRADNLRSVVDKFLCLFPFEIEFYRKRNLPAQFVGHPLLDYLPVAPNDKPGHVEPIVGLLPGSRPDEIRRHLPIMIETCDLLSQKIAGLRVLLFSVPHVPRELYRQIIEKSKPSRFLVEIIQDENYVWRSELDMAITASGMETLENALLGVPMVIIYKMNWITFGIAKLLVRIPHIGMPNLLAGKMIVPEFIQNQATPSKIIQPLLSWVLNPSSRIKLRKELLSLRKMFGELGASDRAARVILEEVA
jgi:lipid-A-disaccharide synthase